MVMFMVLFGHLVFSFLFLRAPELFVISFSHAICVPVIAYIWYYQLSKSPKSREMTATRIASCFEQSVLNHCWTEPL